VLVGIQAWLQRAADLSQDRNRFLHCFWSRKAGSEEAPVRMLNGLKWETPTPDQIRGSAEKMHELSDEIDKERLEGWLKGAVARTKTLL
jgi:hypothetical protein